MMHQNFLMHHFYHGAMQIMIDLYCWATPNGHKITIFLEEAGLSYRIMPIDIHQGEQFQPEFLAISPNNKIPAIVDHHPSVEQKCITLFESGAILLYLAEKTQRFLSQQLTKRYQTLAWLFWQVSGLGPMAGQLSHFLRAEQVIPYAIERYRQEVTRLYTVLDQQLADKKYIVDEYSIADMACYPWIAVYEKHQQRLQNFPHLARWHAAMQGREAVVRAYTRITPFTKK